MKTKIVLAPTLDLAKEIQATATVEAEYGDHVVEGSLCTLAHHVKEYREHPAPCNNSSVPLLPEGSTILVSHIDLDTVGGVMALLGVKPEDHDFWNAAEFIDLNGSHHGYTLPDELPKLQAYWAWNHAQPRTEASNEVTDVTDVIASHVSIISQILKGDKELIATGEKWAVETSEKVETCLVDESDRVRVFVTDDVFCSASYYSKALGQIVPITVTMNTKLGSITIATCDSTINAKEIVQSLWGSEAGGHPGIAGSPRGRRMKFDDLFKAIKAVEPNKIIDLWYISCSTGCTCCASENFDQGYYKSEQEAQKVVDEYLKGNGNPLASQYARYGRYHVYKTTAELLPDGRMIVDGSCVYSQDHLGRIEEL